MKNLKYEIFLILIAINIYPNLEIGNHVYLIMVFIIQSSLTCIAGLNTTKLGKNHVLSR